MYKLNFISIVFLASCIALAHSHSSDKDELVKESREATNQLGKQLKDELVNAMQSKGPVAAIEVCNLEAPKISNDVSRFNHLEIGRTSLKIRNPLNQPDAWELKQLNKFVSENAEGVEIKNLEVYEIVQENDKKIFRYMKAIPTQEACILCHGKEIAQPIAEKIKVLYPEDQATGFEVGQLRGAFTIKKELE